MNDVRFVLFTAEKRRLFFRKFMNKPKKTEANASKTHYKEWKDHIIQEKLRNLSSDQLKELKMYLRLYDRRETAYNDYDKSFLYAALGSVITNIIIMLLGWIFKSWFNGIPITMCYPIISLFILTIFIIWIRRRSFIDRYFYSDFLEIVDEVLGSGDINHPESQ